MNDIRLRMDKKLITRTLPCTIKYFYIAYAKLIPENNTSVQSDMSLVQRMNQIQRPYTNDKRIQL